MESIIKETEDNNMILSEMLAEEIRIARKNKWPDAESLLEELR